MFVACASNPTPAPGAQYVNVLANNEAIQLDPATVRVGDNIYVVLEPPTDHVVFIEGKPTAEAEPGPLTDEERAVSGISDGLIRVSVGLENAEDLIADFARALKKAK